MRITIKNEMLYLISIEELNDFDFIIEEKRFVYNSKFKKNPFMFLNKNLRFYNVRHMSLFRKTKHLRNFINSRYKFQLNNIYLSGYLNNLYYIIDSEISYNSLFIINIINNKNIKASRVFLNIFFFFLLFLIEIYKIFIYIYLIDICF